MSDNKRYYYLKVKETFFDGEEMKILESQQNGVIYQNLYLKMCLLSVKSGGALLFKDAIPYDVNMLSSVLRVNIDTVKTGIEIFSKLELIEIIDDKTIYMTDIQSLIGQSSSEGERKKLYRSKIKRIKKINSGRMSGQLSDDVPKKTGHRTPELELKTEPERKTEKESQDFFFSKANALNPNRLGISQEVEADRHHWNEIGAKPPKEKLIMNFEGITPTIQAYTRERRHKAMDNYEAIRKSPAHELRPEYGSLDGFLREGVEKYVDEADPWTRCKKKQPVAPPARAPVYGFVDDDEEEDFSK